ncbi:MAG: shikimate kinase [Campylobacterales bacterium]|nr:shikimate kinase [Campylobacterales bacterium]
MKNKNIVLIGFMGVGKGTTAREIVKHSEMISIDTDDLIESMENRKIKKIFEDEGEAYFRALEQRVAHWIQKSVTHTLISTGGGFYKVENINKVGTVVLLHASFDAILERIKAHPNAERKLKKRPLLHDLDKARKLYEVREAAYRKVADFVIDVEEKSPTEVALEILEKVK